MSGYHKKMKSPMNLSRQGALSQFSEDGIPDDLTNNNVHGIGHSEENITANNVARSFSSGFSIGSWEDSNSIVFSNPASKARIHNNDDIIASISNSYELQVWYYLYYHKMDLFLPFIMLVIVLHIFACPCWKGFSRNKLVYTHTHTHTTWSYSNHDMLRLFETLVTRLY